MRTLTVDLGPRSYPIYIGSRLLAEGETWTGHIPGRQVLVVTNTTLRPLFLDPVLSALEDFDVSHVVLSDGEAYKTLGTVSHIFDRLMELRFNRDATLVALGGGVIGDITGFAAACYMRGVAFLQLPTTLLAQVDSSVGGKTGVNHPRGKNMIGAFHQPRCVVADTGTLKRLDARQFRAGVAEIIKYGLIHDAGFFGWLEQRMDALMDREPDVLAYAIEVSCRTKAAIVAEDERESGRRALLNLGHTFAHAIETGTGYGHWLHGEAVAAGMLMAADLSRRLGRLDDAQYERIEHLLRRAHLPRRAPASLDADRFRELMAGDKKVQGGRLRLVLLRRIGEAEVRADFDPDRLDATLREFPRTNA